MIDAAARMPPGHRHLYFHVIDSTNAEAQRLAAGGENGPLWIWADRQQQGRGRQGRSWISEPGNLYASLLFTAAVAPEKAAGLSLAAPLAVHAALRQLLPERSTLELKWPNDVLLEGRKVAGILIESLSGGAGMIFVIGCGINLREAPEGSRYGATALARHGVHMGPEPVLEMLAASMDEIIRLWDGGRGFDEIRTRWLRHGKGIGKPVRVAVGAEMLEGNFDGLGSGGSMLLRLRSGQLRSIHAGEVQYTDFSEAQPE